MMLYNIGFLILRVGTGLIFIFHGYPKISGGTAQWLWLGTQMKYLGVTFLPVVWGFMAACAEFFGGICLVLGFYTRFAAFFMACNMTVALIMHLNVGDPFTTWSHPLSNLVIFVSLMLMGGGVWSLAGG